MVPGAINLFTGLGSVVGGGIIPNLGTDAEGFIGSSGMGSQNTVPAAGEPVLLELDSQYNDHGHNQP